MPVCPLCYILNSYWLSKLFKSITTGHQGVPDQSFGQFFNHFDPDILKAIRLIAVAFQTVLGPDAWTMCTNENPVYAFSSTQTGRYKGRCADHVSTTM